MDIHLNDTASLYDAASLAASRSPTSEITVHTRGSPADLIRAYTGIEGWRIHRIGSAWHVLTGRGAPKNCASMAAHVLREMGVDVIAYTPDQLWSQVCQRASRYQVRFLNPSYGESRLNWQRR